MEKKSFTSIAVSTDVKAMLEKKKAGLIGAGKIPHDASFNLVILALLENGRANK